MTRPLSQPPKKKSGRRQAEPDFIETAEIKPESTKKMVFRGTKKSGSLAFCGSGARRYLGERAVSNEYDRAASALKAIDPGCDRARWVRVGMAAKAAGLEFEHFHTWSSSAGNYKGERDCLSAWKSFREPGRVTGATLFAEAIAQGWRAPNNGEGSTASAPIPKPVHPAPAPAIQSASAKTMHVWNLCELAPTGHPYMVKKCGVPDGLRIYPHSAPPLVIRGQNVAGSLALPCWAGSHLQTLQFISCDGGKVNMPGASFNDGFFTVGEIVASDRVFVVEGIGQAWAVYAATGDATVVCFGAGRMAKVAVALRKLHAAFQLVLVPDRGKEEQAQVIAAAVGCEWCALPADKPANYDANDYALEFGADALAELLNEAGQHALGAKQPTTTEPAHTLAPFAAPNLSRCDARDGTADTRPLTESGNALRIMDAHGERLRYVHDAKSWLVWNGGAWQWDDGAGVRSMAGALGAVIYAEGVRHIGDAEHFARWARKSQEQRTMVAAVSILADFKQVRLPLASIDADHFTVGFDCARKVIDLRSGVTRPATPSDYITKTLSPVTVGDAAKAVRWMRYLEQVFDGDCDLIDWLQRFTGYMLTGSTQEQIFLFCFGHGANGKSVLIEILKHIMGDYGRAIASETLSESKRQAGGATPDLAALIGARLVLCSETEDNTALAESLVKSLVSGDSMAVRQLYSAPLQFTPNFKLVMAGNHKPIVRGNDNGVWRRVRLVPFNRTFAPDERNPQLLNELKAEASHILAWMLVGCSEWQRQGLADTPAVIRDATDAYQVDQDVTGAWLEENTTASKYGEVSAGDLYASYSTWSIGNGLKPASNRVLGRRLSERGLTVRQSHGKRFWIGLALRQVI